MPSRTCVYEGYIPRDEEECMEIEQMMIMQGNFSPKEDRNDIDGDLRDNGVQESRDKEQLYTQIVIESNEEEVKLVREEGEVVSDEVLEVFNWLDPQDQKIP